MKAYYIADILTASRFLFAGIITAMTTVAAHPAWVLLVFAIGELTDAADGPAASRWPYPDDLEQRLWWRVNKIAFDIAADMTLGIATLAYCARHTYPFGRTLFIGSLAVGTVSQLCVLYLLPPADQSKITKWVILLRRSLLYIPAITAVVILLLLKATVPDPLTWDAVGQSLALKVWLCIGITIGVALLYLKRDRIAEVTRNDKKIVKMNGA